MRHDFHRHLTTAVLVGGSLLPAAIAAAQTPYRVIAVTGGTAPGTNAVLDDVHMPRINAAGQVAFFARLVNGDTVLYRTVEDDPADLELILRTGDDVPGGPVNATFGSGGTYLLLNEDGDLGFEIAVDGLNEVSEEGVFRFRDDVLETVALVGQQVPGLAPGLEYAYMGFPAMNSAGSMAFRATMQGPGVVYENDSAIMAHGFGGLNVVLREGNAVASRPQDDWGHFGWPHILDNGMLAFQSALNGDLDSIWTGWPGLLSVDAVAGENGMNAEEFLGFSLSEVGMNLYSVDPYGFMRDTGGGFQAAALVGDAGPIGTYTWIDFYHGNTNASGELLFVATFDGPAAAADTALVRIRPNGQESIMLREGDQAPSYPNGVEIDDMSDVFDVRIEFDDAGRHYFSVPLRGNNIDETNDEALFARDLNGSIVPLLREGSGFEVAPNDYRIVDEFGFATGSTHGGRRGGSNDLGDLALWVNFEDGSEAIVVAQLGVWCAGDFNHDGRIDVNDLVILITNWGQTTAIGADGDTDRNGVVDVNDLNLLILSWGFCV